MTALMRPETAVEWAANAAVRWRSQYSSWTPDNRFNDGTTKGETDDALDTQAHTPENIARILNDGWAYPDCSACGKRYHVLARFKEEWGNDSWAVCLPCARKMVALLEQFPNAVAPVKP